MTVWFSADLHLDHANIIKYANRDFPNVETMNEVLIERWNSLVRPGDIVWHLGDFAFSTAAGVAAYRKRLTGEIHLILGNHDRENYCKKAGFASVDRLRMIKVGDTKIVLCHYAMRTWQCSHWGSLQLYGHSHAQLPDDPNLRSMDVGVDAHDFYPISFEAVMDRMKKKNFIPVDKNREEPDESEAN